MNFPTNNFGGRGLISFLITTGRKDLIEIEAFQDRGTSYKAENAIDLNANTRYGSDYSTNFGQYFHINFKNVY